MLIFLIVEGLCGAYVLTDGDTDITEDDLHRGQDPRYLYPISQDHQSGRQGFGLWVKLISADLISNVLQYHPCCLSWLSHLLKRYKTSASSARGIFFLGGMLAVLVGPGQVAQLIGGDGMGLFMTMQGFQAMSALKGVTQAIGQKGSGWPRGCSSGDLWSQQDARPELTQNYPDGGGISSNNPMTSAYDPEAIREMVRGGSGSEVQETSLQSFPTTYGETGAGSGKYGIDISDMSKGDASLALDKQVWIKSYWRGFRIQQVVAHPHDR